MGGIYHDIWTCSNCNYKDKTVSAPLVIEPKEGTKKSIIEYRWCNSCSSIQRCFIGKGYIYNCGDEPNSKIDKYRYKDITELKTEIEKLELKKKASFLFSLSKDAKKLNVLKALIRDYMESQLICESLTSQTTNFYLKSKPNPKCLICGSEDISKKEWRFDNHSCGGSFMKEASVRTGQVGSYQYIEYDDKGNTVIIEKELR